MTNYTWRLLIQRVFWVCHPWNVPEIPAQVGKKLDGGVPKIDIYPKNGYDITANEL